MIIVIDALNRDRYPHILEDMFRLRARVFEGRLGWDVSVENGMEIDRFDSLDPAYVIGLDDEGHVISCVRALQTTGPHMLADVFSAILGGEPPLRSATLWESTRFCVDTQRLARTGSGKSISNATSELMIGALEYARSAGIADIVAVIDPVMDRILKRSENAPYDYVGQTTQMGKVPAMAALLDCTEERIARVRAFADIHEDVFATAEDLEALSFTHEVRAATDSDLVGYLRSQMSSATAEEDRQAVLRLAACLDIPIKADHMGFEVVT